MDNSTRRMINSLAEDVLSAYNISVPIGNIDEIVEKLGGTIQKEAFFSDGAVEKEGNGFKIIVSPFQDEKRERFTIAHELGHLFLHIRKAILKKMKNIPKCAGFREKKLIPLRKTLLKILKTH